MKGNKKIKVVGIGNAIVDIAANVDDEFLKVCKLDKGSMRLVCEKEADLIHSQITVKKIISGGSVANTIAGLAILGNRVGFIGKVKDDSMGNTFEYELKKLGVIFNTEKAKKSGLSTARCIVLTTPDSQRTMNTCLGIAGKINPKDIDENIINDSEIVFLEGYLWDQDTARNAVKKVIEVAHKARSRIALTLSDKFCVERHNREFNEAILNHVDILFANEDEIKALFRISDIEYAIKEISKLNIIAAVTRSETGSIIVRGNKILGIPIDRTVVIDSTGAGDMYAAGFLHGLISGNDLYNCGWYGSVVAAEVISHFGARPEKPLLKLLAEKGL